MYFTISILINFMTLETYKLLKLLRSLCLILTYLYKINLNLNVFTYYFNQIIKQQ